MKKLNDEKKLRSKIIQKSFEDYKMIDKNHGKMAKNISMMKKIYLQEMGRKQMRKNIINSLNEESKTWLSNIEGDFEKVVIPNVTLSENDYF